MASPLSLLSPHWLPSPAQRGDGSVSTTSGERARGKEKQHCLAQLPLEGSHAVEASRLIVGGLQGGEDAGMGGRAPAY